MIRGHAAPLGLAFVALAACVDTGSLAGGTSGSSGTSGTTPESATDVVIEPSSMDLPDTDCGQEVHKSFAIVNRSKTDVEYKVTSIDPAFTIASNANGVIRGGGATTIEVSATPQTAQEVTSSLLVEVNGMTRPYPVKVRGRGATFELSQSTIDFGDVRKENGAETKIMVTNVGAKSLDTTLAPVAPTADFDIAQPSIHLEPGATSEIAVRLKPGASNLAPIVAQFKPTPAGICGTLPALDVRGKRITTDVTVDVVDWGDVGCKSNPGDRDAVIKNYAPQPLTYTASISGTAFTIASGGSGSVAAGSEANPSTQRIKLKVTPGTVPGQKDETLTITYGTGQTNSGKVRAYVYGLVLTIVPASYAFHSNGTVEQTRTFAIVNNGKFGGAVTIPVTYQTTGAGFRAVNGTTPFTIFGAGGSVEVGFKATQSGTVSGNLVVGGVVCSQTAVALTGANP